MTSDDLPLAADFPPAGWPGGWAGTRRRGGRGKKRSAVPGVERASGLVTALSAGTTAISAADTAAGSETLTAAPAVPFGYPTR